MNRVKHCTLQQMERAKLKTSLHGGLFSWYVGEENCFKHGFLYLAGTKVPVTRPVVFGHTT